MGKKLRTEDVHTRLAARRLTWVGGEYKNMRSRITVKCEKDHEFSALATSLIYDLHGANSNGCRRCMMAKSRRPKKVHILYYNKGRWCPASVMDNLSTADLDKTYGRNNWKLT